jgi:hypothetical protein
MLLKYKLCCVHILCRINLTVAMFVIANFPEAFHTQCVVMRVICLRTKSDGPSAYSHRTVACRPIAK